MKYDGTYKLTSHFLKIGRHGGKLFIETEGEKLTGRVYSLGMWANIEDGVIIGNEFSYTMVTRDMPFTRREVRMYITGSFDGENIQGKMKAAFGKSRFVGKKIS